MDDVAVVGVIFGTLVPVVLFIGLFTFLAIAARSSSRQKIAESQGRYEFLKKISESASFEPLGETSLQLDPTAFAAQHAEEGFLGILEIGRVATRPTLSERANEGVLVSERVIGAAELRFVGSREVAVQSAPTLAEDRLTLVEG